MLNRSTVEELIAAYDSCEAQEDYSEVTQLKTFMEGLSASSEDLFTPEEYETLVGIVREANLTLAGQSEAYELFDNLQELLNQDAQIEAQNSETSRVNVNSTFNFDPVLAEMKLPAPILSPSSSNEVTALLLLTSSNFGLFRAAENPYSAIPSALRTQENIALFSSQGEIVTIFTAVTAEKQTQAMIDYLNSLPRPTLQAVHAAITVQNTGYAGLLASDPIAREITSKAKNRSNTNFAEACIEVVSSDIFHDEMKKQSLLLLL